MRFLVVGCGSIGKRHIASLQILGHEIVCYDTQDSVLDELKAQGLEVTKDAALKTVDAHIICTPPRVHFYNLQQAWASGVPAFVEKPLDVKIDTSLVTLLADFDKKGLIAQVGYQLRFNPWLKRAKELLSDDVLGKIYYARAFFGQDLRDWHPIEDYRDSYVCNTGIVLDGSHEIDYMRWLFGEPDSIHCEFGNVSSLEMTAEDCAEIALRFRHGVLGSIHLDCVYPAYRRDLEVVGEKGILKCVPDHLEVRSRKGRNIETMEQSDPYLEEMKHFIECIRTGEQPLVNARDALTTLRLALKAKNCLST